MGLLPPGTVESIELLLKRSPGNLHVAMAFRSNPGLDLAAHFLDGSGIILRAPLFRFSRPEIARFFDDALSRRELATVEERTAGWPVALMVDRNMRAAGAEQPDVDPAELSENYVGVRLLRGLSRQDREGGDAEALAFDRVLTQAVLAGGTCRFLHGELDHLRPAAGATACVGERARFRSSAWHLLRCISCCHRAEFEESRRHGVRARACFADDMRYGDVFASIYRTWASRAPAPLRNSPRESWTCWRKSGRAAGTRKSRAPWESPTAACATT